MALLIPKAFVAIWQVFWLSRSLKAFPSPAVAKGTVAEVVQGGNPAWGGIGITAAGTAPVFHRIPY